MTPRHRRRARPAGQTGAVNDVTEPPDTDSLDEDDDEEAGELIDDPHGGPPFRLVDDPEFWSWQQYRYEVLHDLEFGMFPYEDEAADLRFRLEWVKAHPEDAITQDEWEDAQERQGAPLTVEKWNAWLDGTYEPIDHTME